MSVANAIIRIPIIAPKVITRTPIIDPEVLKIIDYYNKKCAEVYEVETFSVICKREPWNHRNWKFFMELYTLGKKFKWNFEDYIDAQFHRARKWHNTHRPFVNQLCSVAAINYYYDYIDDYK
jgi:hypothetical protein